jgi:hypothetical protein
MRCEICHGTGRVMRVPQSREISRCPDCRRVLARALLGAVRSLLRAGREIAAPRKPRAA